ncbi:MAG TPA: glycosyltransferase family 39 protein, partial [Ktedonobacteraceae bacterium]|nr:glycosyltransferase family 39 protein [Ktedonobacteraceae bacterium]
MTVSYTPQQDQDPQQPARQTPGADAPGTARQPGSPTDEPTRVVEPIRRKIVVRSPVTPSSGMRYFASDQADGPQSQPLTGQPLTPNEPRPQNGVADVDRLPTSALPAPSAPPVDGHYRQLGQQVQNIRQDMAQVRQPSALRNGASNSVIDRIATAVSPASTPSAPPSRAATASSRGTAARPEVENGNIILYRTHNFFLRTAFRSGQTGNPLRRPSGHTSVMPRVMPDQEKRVAASDTHVMPSIIVNPGKQARAIPIPSWSEAILVMFALIGTCVAHAYNMFNFPRYELDEGTYMSYAWAILHGNIASEPYGYGHPPLGWIQIAGWIQMTGGFFTFGTAINSGRVLMLLYALGSALLVYLIVRRMSGSASAGLLALVIFSFSPLSITYQRQVFLDNIAVFWLLMSFYLLVVGNSRLKFIIGAAISFGVAFLSKETSAVFFPAIVYAAWLYSTKFQRKFSMTAFIYTIMAVCSTWVLMAVLKGELFPYTWHLPWDTHPHLSMLDTFVGQAQRGVESGSLFSSFQIWQENDPVFIILSIAAPAFNLLYGWWNRKHLMLALMAALYWLLLVRGGQVLSFYVIMLIPVTALNTAMALNAILNWGSRIGHWRWLNMAFTVTRALLLLVALAAILPYDIQETSFRFYQHPTSAQEQAMVWIRDHVSRDSFIVINSYLYLDLRLPGGTGVGDSAPFPHAEVYWEVAYDPTLHDKGGALQDNWDRIDYIVADSEMLNDIKTYGGPMDLIKTAYEHS